MPSASPRPSDLEADRATQPQKSSLSPFLPFAAGAGAHELQLRRERALGLGAWAAVTDRAPRGKPVVEPIHAPVGHGLAGQVAICWPKATGLAPVGAKMVPDTFGLSFFQ